MTQIALITGGSRGLGRNAALKLAAKGGGVVLTYHSQAEAAEAVVAEIAERGGTAIALRLDTGDVASFAAFRTDLTQALRATWQRETLDFLINNAGHGSFGSIAEMSEEAFDDLVSVHFKGVFFLSQTLMPMIEDGGRILNLSTGLARFCAPGLAAYASAKGAVEVFTRYLAQELGPRGIAVNALAPGAIETDFGGGAVRDVAEVNAGVAAVTAMGRAGQPDDVGDAIADLLVGSSQWITAQRIEVSGGMNL